MLLKATIWPRYCAGANSPIVHCEFISAKRHFEGHSGQVVNLVRIALRLYQLSGTGQVS